ncbi:MAG: hypothetical protein GY753_03955 [Gammaproteobacteria bacterium]|nr:hypothetical protein [Gammaproteobacteria bacterium]
MRFKVDENLPIEVAEVLRQAGYDAFTVKGQDLVGSPDSEISVICQNENRAVVTLDLGFADIRAYPPDQFPGLLVMKLRQQDKAHVLKVLRRIIPMFSSETLNNRLWIVEEERVRVRN